MCLGFGLSCTVQLDDKFAIRGALTRAGDPGLQRSAPRRRTLGEALQRVGEPFALAVDVEHIAMAGRVAPRRFLPGAQAPSGIGDRVVGPQSLRGGVEQVHAPGVRVTVSLCGQDVAVARVGIDAGQHRRGTLEELVVQAHPNA